jgi:hypothetical protein
MPFQIVRFIEVGPTQLVRNLSPLVPELGSIQSEVLLKICGYAREYTQRRRLGPLIVAALAWMPFAVARRRYRRGQSTRMTPNEGRERSNGPRPFLALGPSAR